MFGLLLITYIACAKSLRIRYVFVLIQKSRTNVDVGMVPDQGLKKGRTLRAQTSNEQDQPKKNKGKIMVEIKQKQAIQKFLSIKKKQAIQKFLSPLLIFSLAS